MADEHTNERFCQKFLRAAARKVRTAGLARGHRMNDLGQVCMLGAMDYCGVGAGPHQRRAIDKHVASVLPEPPKNAVDKYNFGPIKTSGARIAYWSNMVAKNAEEVAQKLLLAAESC